MTINKKHSLTSRDIKDLRSLGLDFIVDEEAFKMRKSLPHTLSKGKGRKCFLSKYPSGFY